MSQSNSNKQQYKGTNPEPQLTQTIIREFNKNPVEKPMISRLINSVHYFIRYVFIIQLEDTYRLVALNKRKVLFNKLFPTARGSRISFQKTFNDLACYPGVKAEWSHFYSPDKQWLENKCKYLNHQ